MAKPKTVRSIERKTPTPKRTSIGKKRGWKKYRGQGK